MNNFTIENRVDEYSQPVAEILNIDIENTILDSSGESLGDGGEL